MTTTAIPNPIIVALDVESAAEARALVARIGPRVNFYKVGMELYAAAGMDFVREMLSQGHQVFLDLKLYDIPETVSRAVARVAETGVRFLTVHAVGSVMRAAVAGRAGSRLQLLGVTVLTSFGPEDLDDLGYQGTVAELVARRARKAMELGVDGVVASPLEAAAVRALIGPDRLLVTPGVRSAGADKGDQKRVATPAQAVSDGANYIVIGRQITRAADPAAEVDRVLAEIAGAFANPVR
jgi:orotidine-5'-phosphate decarboxylase